jgi:hypothetical protein
LAKFSWYFNHGIDTSKILALSNHKPGILNNYIRISDNRRDIRINRKLKGDSDKINNQQFQYECKTKNKNKSSDNMNFYKNREWKWLPLMRNTLSLNKICHAQYSNLQKTCLYGIILLIKQVFVLNLYITYS